MGDGKQGINEHGLSIPVAIPVAVLVKCMECNFCCVINSSLYLSSNFLLSCCLNMLSHRSYCKIMVSASVYNVWNARDFSFCDLIAPSQFMAMSRMQVYECHQTFPFYV